MTTPSIFLKTTLIGALLVTCPALLHAASYVSLQPTETWNVQSYPPEKDGEVPFCTLDKAFGGYRLLFSMNKEYPAKIILSVPADVYPADKKYDIRLVGDSKAEQKFAGSKPVDGYFTLEIEKDAPALAALRSARSVKFLINTTLLEFQTTDLPQAMENLTNCINGGEAPTPVVEAPVTSTAIMPVPTAAAAVPVAPEPVISAVPEPVIAAKVSPMQDYLEEKQTIREVAPAESPAPVIQPDMTSSERDLLKSLKKKVGILEAEKESLRVALAQQRPGDFAPPKDAVCNGKLADLEQQVQQLQTSASTIAAKTAECAPLADAKAAAADVSKTDILSLNKQIDTLTAENRSMQKQLRAAKGNKPEVKEPVQNASSAELDLMAKNLKDAEAKIAALEKEIEDVQQENMSLLEEPATSATSATPSPADLQKLSILEKEIAELRTQNTILQDAAKKVSQAPVCPVAPVMDDKIKAELSILRAEHDAYVELLKKCPN